MKTNWYIPIALCLSASIWSKASLTAAFVFFAVAMIIMLIPSMLDYYKQYRSEKTKTGDATQPLLSGKTVTCDNPECKRIDFFIRVPSIYPYENNSCPYCGKWNLQREATPDERRYRLYKGLSRTNYQTATPTANVKSDTAIICPKCKARNAYHASGKGFGLGKAAVGGVLLGPVGLLGGLIGSKKLVVQCISCGHKWNP